MTTSSLPARAGLAAPESGDAQVVGTALGIRRNETADGADCADLGTQRQAGAPTARAARLGLEVRALEGGAWLLCRQRGAAIGVVRGRGALLASLAAFEAPHRDVLSLIAQRVGRAAHG
jgi:hypothetical protein